MTHIFYPLYRKDTKQKLSKKSLKIKGLAFYPSALIFFIVYFIFILNFVAITDARADGNNILGVSVISETLNEVTLVIRYKYTGNYGSNVAISAVMASNGKSSQYFAYAPGRIKVGTHRTKVVLGISKSAPKLFTTDQLLVEMYVGGGKSFVKRLFFYPKTWSKPGAALTPVLSEIKVLKPIIRPQNPQIVKPSGGKERQRRILGDGRVEIRYSDGTIKRVSEGGYTVIKPDGTEESVQYSHAQPPTPPSAPPNSQHLEWLEYESDGLLHIIRSLVANDEESVNNYLQSEGSNISYYQKISFRRKAIGYLLQP